MSNRPRHTMSRNAPLAWRHCQDSQSLGDSVRRLSCGCCSISARNPPGDFIRMTTGEITFDALLQCREQKSAVDYKSLSGNERASAACEQHCHFCNFDWLPDARNWLFGKKDRA